MSDSCPLGLPFLQEHGHNFSQVEDVTHGRVVFQREEKTIFFQFAVKFLLFVLARKTRSDWMKTCTQQRLVPLRGGQLPYRGRPRRISYWLTVAGRAGLLHRQTKHERHAGEIVDQPLDRCPVTCELV